MVMKAHHELIFLFAYVVNVIQNGPVSKAHINLASVLSPSDGIVTFNWDTLMDRALAESTEWRVDSGYGVAAAYGVPEALEALKHSHPAGQAGRCLSCGLC